MRNLPKLLALAAMLTASAAPAATRTDRPLPRAPSTAQVDRLFPGTSIEGEGWQGLLPIMLFNLQLEAQRPVLRSERSEATTR